MSNSKIRIFPYNDNLSQLPSTTPSPKQKVQLQLSLSNKGSLWLLVDSTLDTEPVWSIINSCGGEDPFPENINSSPRIWLKQGTGMKDDDAPIDMMDQLVAAGVIESTGISNSKGLPLVRILLTESELCMPCSLSSCGKFERTNLNLEKEVERFKRCARCKLNFYCSTICQSTDWNESHRSECLDLPSDDPTSIAIARRRKLLRLNGRILDSDSNEKLGKSKSD